MIVVYGYFCDKFKASRKEREKELQLVRHYDVSAVETYCNEEQPHSMTTNIVKSMIDKRGLLETPTPFVLKIIRRVCAALHNNERILLVGHSYGGSVVTRVGLHLERRCGILLKNRRLLKNLKIITFGSILAPNLRRTVTNLDLTHYAYKYDIAKLCHDKSYACKTLPPRKGKGPVGSHMNYNHLITNVARSSWNWSM